MDEQFRDKTAAEHDPAEAAGDRRFSTERVTEGLADSESDSIAARLAPFLDATNDAVIFLDRDYRLTYMNRRARELLAPAGADLVGRRLMDAFPGIEEPGTPYMPSYRKSMEQRQASEFEAFYPAPLNLWFRVQSYPAEDGIIIFFRDFTGERRALDALREKSQEAERQRMEIESVYATAPIGLALFDTEDFRYLRLNNRQAEFFGLTPEQVVGRTLTEMAPIEGLRELFEQVREGRPVVNHLLEGSLVTRPNEHRYWTVSYYPVYASDGSVQAITAASLEITQQKRAEEALIQSEKLAAVGRLASSISHEINNPLEAVTNLVYLVSNDPGLPAHLRQYTEQAQAELARVSHIATQTLKFRRESMHPVMATAPALLDSVLDLYRGRLLNTGVHLEVRHASREPFRCFESDIRQVLSNLLSNAIDAMRVSGGRLLIRSHDVSHAVCGRPGVRITVADTGTGMNEETAARVYEAFFTTKDSHGTGLGLWISSEIVARHGGKLHFRSTQDPVLHGTVFTLMLPRELLSDAPADFSNPMSVQ